LRRESLGAAGAEATPVPGLGGDEVALGNHVRADEVGNPRSEEWCDERGAPAIVVAVVVGVRDVGDVVYEAGDGQLGIMRVLDSQDRAALESVGEAVERGLVANAGAECEQLEEIGHGRDRIHVAIFARSEAQ